ncbi:MAG: hypothetical protein HC802_12995 [Caldilineaceae bacterium]|nr:hypothetical protein [Caldilineaceae bacterium]
MKIIPTAILTYSFGAGRRSAPWFPAGLILELERELGASSHVVTDTGLNPYLREHVLEEAVPL